LPPVGLSIKSVPRKNERWYRATSQCRQEFGDPSRFPVPFENATVLCESLTSGTSMLGFSAKKLSGVNVRPSLLTGILGDLQNKKCQAL
jgi:hypothetical protein